MNATSSGNGNIAFISLRWLLITLGSIYFVIPILIRITPSLRRSVMFLAFVRRPFTNLTHPQEHFNLSLSRNFYIENGDDIRLGVWQILPEHHQNSLPENWDWDAALSQLRLPIVLYLHGIAFDRAANHRRELYHLLAQNDYHVLTLDYRGFGDSTGHPTAEGVVSDSRRLYDWIARRAGSNPIFVWGHSLGTAVATEMVGQLHDPGLDQNLIGPGPAGLVLEAPFNNLDDVVEHHPLTTPFRWLPWFKWLISNPIHADPICFATENRIRDVACPVMIVHAQDDHVVPVSLGARVFAAAQSYGVNVEYHEFDASHHYEHKFCCRAPELPSLMKNFVRKCLDLNSS